MTETAPFTMTVQNANTLYMWEEKLCIKCTLDSQEISMDQITFIKQGICQWYKVRHIQEGSSTWYPSTDRLAGTDVFGSSSDDSQPWGIRFDNIDFDQFLFTTNNFQHFIILPKSTFIEEQWKDRE